MTNAISSIDVLGVNVSCTQRADVLRLPIKWANEPHKRTIFYANAHCLNLADKDLDYRETLNTADLLYADGISIVWAAKFLGGCKLEKATGRDWIYDFCALAEKNNLRLFFLAGKPGIAHAAAQKLILQYPGLEIVGTHHGYLGDISISTLLFEINRANPDILLIGMGTPLQEKWLAAHRDRINAPVCWAIGALFDYVAGLEPPVPDWLNRLNLEWFWRLLANPLGKWRRYLIGNPLFLARVFNQMLNKMFHHR